MVDPIVGGAGKSGADLFKEASKQMQNASDQVSKFEELRQKMDAQEMTAPKMNQNSGFQIQHTEQAQNAPGAKPVDPTGNAQKATEIPKVTDMKSLQQVVDQLKTGQNRLKDLIQQSTSGKTFSPQELIGLQAEVSQITNEMQLAAKVVEQGVSAVKSTMQMQV